MKDVLLTLGLILFLIFLVFWAARIETRKEDFFTIAEILKLA